MIVFQEVLMPQALFVPFTNGVRDPGDAVLANQADTDFTVWISTEVPYSTWGGNKILALQSIKYSSEGLAVYFRENHNMDPPTLNDRATKTKRRISDSAEEPASKRRAGPSRPLTSSYNPTISQVVAATPPFCIVNLEIVPLNLESGKQIFPWKGEMMLTGVRLCNDAMAVGKDRTVYKMELNGVAYVAKRCRHVPTDVQEFMDCDQQLRHSVLWLHRTSTCLDEFYDYADVSGCENDVHEGKCHHCFEVQPAFIAAEVLANARPSVASGVAEEDMVAGVDDEGKPYSPRIIWVLQRCNGKTQDRLNLVRPQHLQPNKIDATLLAFAHFFWEKHVKGPEVLSHLQTSQGKMSNNQYGKLIFDVVAQDDRTFADDGSRGAQMVKEMHQCNRVCQLFGLKPDAATEEEDEEKDSDEEET
ncbi:hypothetical protein DFH06DRAFT_1122285 [Mycena polygramma]|nr:hypothetical protein DFH06DRAFT_1122285 [Mycena polygramma]